MRLPIVKSLHIENFSGTSINVADYFNRNAIIGEYDDGRLYATQRPSIDIFDDASVAGTPPVAKGRGVYFWDKAGTAGDRYIVVDDKIYKNTVDSVAIHTISSGTGKVYFVEMVNWLVILDPENNEGWYIANGTPWTTVVQITDINFPGQSSNTDELTGGGVFLDGTLYVGGKSGAIYGSDLTTPVDWDVNNKVSAEREADEAVYIDKHLDHVVLFGTRTIEFFYNAANEAPASPLSRRKDIFHNVGMMQGDAAWREGDDIYFVAVYPSGPLEVMRLNQFQLTNISTPELETYITNSRLVEDANFTSSGFTSGHRSFYILTFYRLDVSGLVEPIISLCFDGTSWGCWCSDLAPQSRFPLIGWTIRSGSSARSGEGILTNGDLITISDDFNPVDTLLATSYIASGYIASGYYVSSGGTGANIEMEVRTGPFDGDTNHWKFGHRLEVVGDETESQVNATIKWADGNSVNFNAGRTIDLSQKQAITRLGRFKRRNHSIVIDAAEQYRIEALEIELTEGGH